MRAVCVWRCEVALGLDPFGVRNGAVCDIWSSQVGKSWFWWICFGQAEGLVDIWSEPRLHKYFIVIFQHICTRPIFPTQTSNTMELFHETRAEQMCRTCKQFWVNCLIEFVVTTSACVWWIRLVRTRETQEYHFKIFQRLLRVRLVHEIF